jgi:hypothetical protein
LPEIDFEDFLKVFNEILLEYGDLTDTTVSVSSADDNLLVQGQRGSETLQAYVCHMHSGGGSHCDPVQLETVPTHVYQPIVSFSESDLANLVGGPEALAQYDPSLWVWIAMGTVTFYFAKKAINKVLFGQFLAKEADSHSHLVLNRHALESQIQNREQVLTESLATLPTILQSMHATSGQPNSSPDQANLIAVDTVTEDTRLLIKQLVRAATGQSCGHDHSHDHDHPSSHKGCASSQAQAQNSLLNGGALRFATTLGSDLYRELIRPIYLLGKGLGQMIFQRGQRRQLSAYARVEANRVLTETDAVFTASFLTGVVGMKTAGEFLESLVVGPYHAFCHVSDAAVLVVGMSIWASYHCVRQVAKFGSLKTSTDSAFWKVILGSFRQRLRVATSTGQQILSLPESEKGSTYLALRLLSRELKVLVRQKNASGELENSQASQIARWLGSLNKQLEDLATKASLKAENQFDSQHFEESSELRAWFDQMQRLIELTVSWSDQKRAEVQQGFAAAQCKQAIKTQ